MKKYDLENSIISCIIQKPKLIEELYISDEIFVNEINRTMIKFFKKEYEKYKSLDLMLMINDISGDKNKNLLIEYCTQLAMLESSPSFFYEYQDKLVENYRNSKIKKEILSFTKDDTSNVEVLVEKINEINNEVIVEKKGNKLTPEMMKKIIRNKGKLLIFDRLGELNNKLKIKLNTVNVIGARPSEGKSALALNMFCDLAKSYNCLYFNIKQEV